MGTVTRNPITKHQPTLQFIVNKSQQSWQSRQKRERMGRSRVRWIQVKWRKRGRKRRIHQVQNLTVAVMIVMTAAAIPAAAVQKRNVGEEGEEEEREERDGKKGKEKGKNPKQQVGTTWSQMFIIFG